MAGQKRLRENSHLSAAGWSNWEIAMVPPNVVGNNLEPRGPNQVGSICSSIRSAFPSMAQHCGIYEWRAKGTLLGQPNYAVYIGSTCRDKPGALRGRILEYCNNGSHKVHLMNDALRRGYQLWVRVKIVEGSHPSREKAENMENTLLATYDYAWNIRNNNTNNGNARNILP